MNVLACLRFMDVFLLQDQSKRLFRARRFPGKAQGLRVRRESIVIVLFVLCVRCAPLRVAPHTIFQYGVPDEPSACATNRGILPTRAGSIALGKRVLFSW
jgi:hypothetical protein